MSLDYDTRRRAYMGKELVTDVSFYAADSSKLLVFVPLKNTFDFVVSIFVNHLDCWCVGGQIG